MWIVKYYFSRDNVTVLWRQYRFGDGDEKRNKQDTAGALSENVFWKPYYVSIDSLNFYWNKLPCKPESGFPMSASDFYFFSFICGDKMWAYQRRATNYVVRQAVKFFDNDISAKVDLNHYRTYALSAECKLSWFCLSGLSVEALSFSCSRFLGKH